MVSKHILLLLASSFAGLAHSSPTDAKYLVSDLNVDQFQMLSSLVPKPVKVTIDLSTDYFQGKEEHFSVPLEDGSLDEFSIFIKPGTVSPDDPDLDYVNFSPRTDIQPAHLFERDLWQCAWLEACWETVRFTAAVSNAAINTAVNSMANYLRDADYAVLRDVLRGYIEQFVIGITGNFAFFYIANKLQAQNIGSPGVCQTDNLEAQIAQLQADMRAILTAIQAGDSRPRMYDHFSRDTVDGREGQHLKHTVVPTTDSNGYKAISSC